MVWNENDFNRNVKQRIKGGHCASLGGKEGKTKAVQKKDRKKRGKSSGGLRGHSAL